MQVNYLLGLLVLTAIGVFLLSLLGAIILSPLIGCLVTAGVLCYVFVGYPAIVFLFHDRAPRDTSGPRQMVTVLVPAHNEQELIAQKVANCLDQSYPAELLEVIVVDDASSDETVARLSQVRCSQLTIVKRQERGGKSLAIADGIQAARGEVIVLTDANVFFNHTAIETLVAALSVDGFPCITGNVRLISPTFYSLNAESTYQGFEGWLLYHESQMHTAVCVDGGMYAIYRESILTPPGDTILDDFAISVALINQGGKIGFAPAATAKESSSAGVFDEFKRRVRLAEGSIQTLKRGIFPHPRRCVAFWQFVSHKLLRWMTPFLVMLLVTSLAILAREYTIASLCLLLFVTTMSIAFFGLMVPRLRRFKLVGMASYALLVQVAIVCGTTRGLFWSANPKWQHAQRFPA